MFPDFCWFLLFLQEIISKRYASAAEILGFRGAARDKNSEHRGFSRPELR
jgi:hypothetical protein